MGRHKKTVEIEFNPIFEPLFYDNLDDPRYFQVYGGRGCFSANQQIKMADGSTSCIKDVRVGDVVKSFNTVTKKIEDKEVTSKFKYENDELLEIRLKSGKIIRCTKDHRFLFSGKWETAWDILTTPLKDVEKNKEEDYSISLNDVDSFHIVKSNEYVYDIEVKDNHNYLLDDYGKSIIVHNSGKSFAVSFAMVQLTYSKYKHKILYLRQTMSSSEDSTISDVRNAIEIMHAGNDFREVKGVITNIRTGATITFKGIKSSGNNSAKLKSLSGVTTLVVEEAEEIESFEEFSKIDESIRIKGKPLKIILIYNPGQAMSSWIHKEWFKEGLPNPARFKDTIYLHSTYLDNIDNLNASTVERYRSLKETNPIYYENTILANWTLDSEGRIYAGWGEYDYFDNYDESDIWYGLDFGYGGHDRTSLIKISFFEGFYYVEEVFSEDKMSIQRTLTAMRRNHVPFNALIYADSAVPELLEQIRKGGYRSIRKAFKGNVDAGIKRMQDKNIVLIGGQQTKLYYAYKTFARKKDGKIPHEPDELAALRYGINSRRPIEKAANKRAILQQRLERKRKPIGFLRN